MSVSSAPPPRAPARAFDGCPGVPAVLRGHPGPAAGATVHGKAQRARAQILALCLRGRLQARSGAPAIVARCKARCFTPTPRQCSAVAVAGGRARARKPGGACSTLDRQGSSVSRVETGSAAFLISLFEMLESDGVIDAVAGVMNNFANEV